jgi:hypothetical protein
LEAYINIIAGDSNAFLFNYKEGMLNVMEDICKVIGIPFTENDREQMQDRLKYHSKSPGASFTPEPAAESDDEKLSHVFELYHRLEELRLGES